MVKCAPSLLWLSCPRSRSYRARIRSHLETMAAFDARRGQRRVRPRGRGLARSRAERHDDPELREARGAGGSAAASRDDRAGGWPTRLLSLQRLDRESFQTDLPEEKIE